MRKWTKERFWEVAKDYPSKEALRKGNKGAHRAGEREGWLQEFPFIEQHRPNNYWNRDRCFEEASKYSTRSEYHKKSPSAYSAAWKNDWLDDYTWFIPRSEITDKCVYVYEFVECNTVYVGLTKDKRARHEQHLGKVYQKWKTAVFRFAEKNNLTIPEPVYLFDNLNAQEAQEKEAEVLLRYKSDGWTILNKAKTGKGVSSLGGKNYMWDEEACRIESAKYQNKREFHKSSAGAYTAALKNGWLNSFFPPSEQPSQQKPKGYWDVYEHCKEEASKYPSRNAFKRGNQVAYKKSSLHGWLDSFYPLGKKATDRRE